MAEASEANATVHKTAPAQRVVEIEYEPLPARPTVNDRVVTAAVTEEQLQAQNRAIIGGVTNNLNRRFDEVVSAVKSIPRHAVEKVHETTDTNQTEARVSEHHESHSSSSSSGGTYFWSSWPRPVQLIVALLLVLVILSMMQRNDWNPIDSVRDSVADITGGPTPSNMCNGRGTVRQVLPDGRVRYFTGC